MKKIFWLLSSIGLTAVSSTAHAEGRIFLSSGDRQVNMSYQAPHAQMSSEDELNEAINRLSANAQSSENRAYAATQNYYNNQQFSAYNEPSFGSAAVNLPSSAAPSIAAMAASRAAHSRSQSRCALYVRRALQSAGYSFTPQASAYMYATNGTLRSAGFVQIDSSNYQPQIGDVVVFNRTSRNPHGHIQIYDGSQWVSDFRQPKFSPYSQHNGYSVWRDARYMDASNQGTYLAMNEQ